MKRLFCMILSLSLLLCCLAGAAGEEELPLLDVYCAEQDFSTKCLADYSTEWEEGNGLRIWMDGPGYVPNVLIFRRPLDKKFNNPVNYLNNVYREYMEDKYGDSVGTNPCQTVEIGEKTVYLARYHYEANGNKLCMARVIEVRDDGDVEFAAKYPEDDPQDAAAALYMAVLYYTAGGGEAPAPTAEMGGSYSVQKSLPIVSGVSEYRDGRFYMNLPNGWGILTQGEYMNFCFKAWDPSNPNRTVFLFMKLEPFLKGQAAKSWYQNAAVIAPDYRLFAEAPMMESCTLAAFLDTMPQITAFCDLFYDSGLTINSAVIPQITDVDILEKTTSTIPAPADCKENSIARISFHDYLGQSCEGLVAAQVRDPLQYIVSQGVDTMPYTVSLFMGVTAPVGELQELEPILTECLGSFGFEDSYVQQAISVSNEQTRELQNQMRQIEAAHDAMMQAWYAREEAHDIAFQKMSDSILGYDRLYDSSTGEIYRADVGFYDSYNLNRSEYGNSNLYLIDSSSSQYYLQGVDYYITK
ncbi:MAG: hypothetical protein Q4G00_13470 [Clostridia bacterium]|nr:hypothetical protein [Clostridia bacterium]